MLGAGPGSSPGGVLTLKNNLLSSVSDPVYHFEFVAIKYSEICENFF